MTFEEYRGRYKRKFAREEYGEKIGSWMCSKCYNSNEQFVFTCFACGLDYQAEIREREQEIKEQKKVLWRQRWLGWLGFK